MWCFCRVLFILLFQYSRRSNCNFCAARHFPLECSLIKSQQLFNGWYYKLTGSSSLKISFTPLYTQDARVP
ncbi:unnamed protein product, partial [Iphiclides podalirius]